MNVNKVILIGRLTKDPEVRSTTSGQTVTSISVATSRSWKDQAGQKQEKTEFHNVVAWAKRGEVIAQYFTKGQEIFVEGHLETRNWDDKATGKKMYRTEVILDNFEFGAKPGGGGGGYANSGAAAVPAAAAGVAAGTAATAAPQQSKPVPTDDIPTINLDDEKDDVNIEDVPF